MYVCIYVCIARVRACMFDMCISTEGCSSPTHWHWNDGLATGGAGRSKQPAKGHVTQHKHTNIILTWILNTRLYHTTLLTFL